MVGHIGSCMCARVHPASAPPGAGRAARARGGRAGRHGTRSRAACPAPPAAPTVRSHCCFRYRGTKYVRKSGMKWMSGSTKWQCDRALAAPPAAPRPWRAARRPARARALRFFQPGVSVYPQQFRATRECLSEPGSPSHQWVQSAMCEVRRRGGGFDAWRAAADRPSLREPVTAGLQPAQQLGVTRLG
jgi:hypothetical protein